MKTLLIATHNQGKVDEFQEMLAPLGIELKSAADFDLPEPEETGTTFTDNALLKAKAGCDATGLPTLADDSGFCVKALNGEPGIYSARWAMTDQGRDFNVAMEAVNEKMGDAADRSAYFIAVLALVYPDGWEEIFEGRIEGQAIWPPRGDRGFGYDPMFVPDGYEATFGEMESDAKHKISHRALAVQQFVGYLKMKAA
ncbi:MAG: RdgB/HAM1 family non-canonical purine NTP pyrophosphatase [Pseudomonadota bacterium]